MRLINNLFDLISIVNQEELIDIMQDIIDNIDYSEVKVICEVCNVEQLVEGFRDG